MQEERQRGRVRETDARVFRRAIRPKTAARSLCLEAPQSCYVFYRAKMQQERTAPNQRNRLRTELGGSRFLSATETATFYAAFYQPRPRLIHFSNWNSILDRHLTILILSIFLVSGKELVASLWKPNSLRITEWVLHQDSLGRDYK